MAALLTAAWLLAVPCAQAAYMVPGQPYRPKDFTLVKKDGYYHLFFIRNSQALLPDQTERDFGHAISKDLYHWEQLPPVLGCDPGEWDNLHVWAPHIVKKDGLYWMMYTGVDRFPGEYADTQMMGLAVSSDLMQWTRVRYDPVFTAAQVPWAWSALLSPRPAFRDPFLMPDPNQPGDWLMYYTGNYATDTTATVVGVARSHGDFTQWEDLKPIEITYSAFSYNSLTESPHMFQHNGLWYLFITTSSGQPLTFYTTPDPTGDRAVWTYRGRLRTMLGYDTSFFYASEYMRDGLRDYFSFVNGDRIELREILWSSSWQFTLVQPPLLHVFGMGWQESTVPQGDLARLHFELANAFAGSVQLEAVWLDAANLEHPVSLDSLGLPTFVSFLADSGTLVWSAKRWPATGDTTTSSRLIIRMADRRATSGVISVLPPTPLVWTPPPPPGGEDPPVPDPGERLPRGATLRALGRSPVGPGPAVALELATSLDGRVDLFDLSGRRVRRLCDRVLPKGVTVLPWDGRDDTGARAARGVYFARFTSGSLALRARVVLLPE
ncbi:MAG: family 43 glycosylhydrolase [Candidatus Eisenbacteria bacterium]